MELIFSQLITDDNMNPANLCSNAEFETIHDNSRESV